MSSATETLRKTVLTTVLGGVLAMVLGLVLAPPTGFAAGATTVSGTAQTEQARAENSRVGSNGAYAKGAFTATNKARRANNRRIMLRGNACLKRAAVRQARTMARTGNLQHQDLGRIQRDCKVGYVGENIAYGYPTGWSLVQRGWMRSSGHRANILNRNYRLMGLAAVKDGDGRWWSAQVFGTRR